eukprot:1394566-Amphidinium_carterae.1
MDSVSEVGAHPTTSTTVLPQPRTASDSESTGKSTTLQSKRSKPRLPQPLDMRTKSLRRAL